MRFMNTYLMTLNHRMNSESFICDFVSKNLAMNLIFTRLFNIFIQKNRTMKLILTLFVSFAITFSSFGH